MGKRIKSILYCILLLGVLLVFQDIAAKAAIDDDYTYSISNEEVRIISYNGSSDDVSIPGEIHDYPVTSIASEAFKGHTEILTLEIPDSVVSVDEKAFNGCLGITEITLPADIDYVGSGRTTQSSTAGSGSSSGSSTGSFSGCTGVKKITSR